MSGTTALQVLGSLDADIHDAVLNNAPWSSWSVAEVAAILRFEPSAATWLDRAGWKGWSATDLAHLLENSPDAREWLGSVQGPDHLNYASLAKANDSTIERLVMVLPDSAATRLAEVSLSARTQLNFKHLQESAPVMK